MTILFQDLYLLYSLPFGLYPKLQMQSTYDQFLNAFKEDLNRVAEFDGEAEQTLNVIIGSLERAKVKQHLDELDAIKQSTSSTPAAVSVAAPTETGRKAVGGGRTKRAAAPSNDIVEGDDSKPTKTKRVTGYNLFVREQVSKNGSSMKDAAAVWKTMDDAARAPYMELANNENKA